jgi:hypothetical protein
MFTFATTFQHSISRPALLHRSRALLTVFCVFAALLAFMPRPLFAQQQDAPELQPPRIGMVNGEASFWRPGASDWSSAQVNIPLAAGDALYTADKATIEVQIGSRAYLRMAQNTMLTLLDDAAGVTQFKMTSGTIALDLRSLPAGQTIELDTPSGAFEINSAGYYRAAFADNATHFIVRRGGQATVTLSDGSSHLIAPSQEAVVTADDGGTNVETYVAPDNDGWDQWNYTRSDDLIDAISNRYVSPEVYGTDDLDQYGNWRITPDYGAVWVPSGMATGWAPYSTGSWVWDPVYAWTWVDTAPWGWAPYHYGRWVNIGSYWAWAPGPRVVRPAYSPALVAFFHSGNEGAVQARFGGPGVSWVALSWGEPCVPWWGRPGFVGRPSWGGWAGPRIVNNVVINNTTVVNNITNIHYRNVDRRNALIAVPERNFGHGRLAGATRLDPAQFKEFKPTLGQHPSRPVPASMMPSAATTTIPAQNIVNRPAIRLRESQARALPWGSEARAGLTSTFRPAVPQSRDVMVRPQAGHSASWAPFGKTPGPERNGPRHPAEPPNVGALPSQTAPQIQNENGASRPVLPSRELPRNANTPSFGQQRQQERERERQPEVQRNMNTSPQLPPPIQRLPPPIQREASPVSAVPQTVPPMSRQGEPQNNSRPEVRRPDAQRPDVQRPIVQQPVVQEPVRPLPQQESPRNVNAPTNTPTFGPQQSGQQRQQERESRRQQEPPRNEPAPPQAVRPTPQREAFHGNVRPEGQVQMPPREMRQERREPPREMRRPEASEALPGQPANRLYQRPDR